MADKKRLGFYDRNADGRIDFGESVFAHAHMRYMENLINEKYNSIHNEDSNLYEDNLCELEFEGLDLNELSLMDEFDRRDAIESVGLDPDDYEFED